jgi:serine protease Do
MGFLRFSTVVGLSVALALAQSKPANAPSPTPEKPESSQPKAEPVALRGLSLSIEALVSRVRHSVVQIFATGSGPAEESESGKTGFFVKQKNTGAGVILSADGYILTNAHVIRASRRIQVRLSLTPERIEANRSRQRSQGETLEATLVGQDREADLAVLKIDKTGLPFLEFGDSDELQQGQMVLAFGNPLGLEGSVSMGIVSATARQIHPDDPMIYIQTDAPINPGNSGGPLVDDAGRVVGINSMILSQSGGSEGLGFAVPSTIAHNIYDQIRRDGHVHRGQIGVRTQTITPAIAKGLRLPQDWGVVVADVVPEGPADEAGIKIGDVIRRLNGRIMDNARELEVNIYRHPLHDSVRLEVLRGSDKLNVKVSVGERVDDPERFADMVNPEKNLVPRIGILGIAIDKEIAPLLPDLRNPYGILVAALSGPSTETGLEGGDVIYSVDNVPITSTEALKRILDGHRAGDTIVLQLERDGELMYLPLELE